MDNKTLIIDDKKIEMDYTIRKKIEFTNQIVILIYDTTVIANNVISFDKQGKELWRINDILNIKRPTGNVDIKKEGENILLVYSSLGMIFKIDIEKKELMDKIFSR
ncbi:MAG: hypothetical protein PHH04_03845 [Thomasclavelia sp.]|nr:hypothetical protein [Thomasclavelia sp.]